MFEYCYTSSIATGCQSLRLSIADYEIGLQKISNSIWIRIQPRFFLVTTATTAATTTWAATATAGRTDSHCSKLSKFRWFAVNLYEIWTGCKFHCVLSYCHYMLELLLLLLLLLFNGILLSNVWISLTGASSAGAFLLGVLEHEDDEELLPVFFLPILVNSNNRQNGVLENFVNCDLNNLTASLNLELSRRFCRFVNWFKLIVYFFPDLFIYFAGEMMITMMNAIFIALLL